MTFIKELANRNAILNIKPKITPFNMPSNRTDLRASGAARRNSVLKYYMSPAVFLPKMLGSSSPAFIKGPKSSLGMSGAYAMSPSGMRSPSHYGYGSGTPHFPNSPGGQPRSRNTGTGSNALLTANLLEMFASDPDRQRKVQELVGALCGRLVRVANIDELMRNMDAWIESSMASQSYEELKQQLTELQIIICDEENKYSEQDKDAANIQYERVFASFTKTSEYQTEIAKIAEEKRRINEPLNRAAWEKLIHIYSRENIKNDPAIRDKIRQNPELTLICMDPKAISAKHMGDFQMYTLNNLTEDEMRAIRAILPKWRSDQKRQADWTDVLENKIDQIAKNPKKEKAPPKPPAKKAVALKAKRPAAAPTGDVFAELLAKRKRL